MGLKNKKGQERKPAPPPLVEEPKVEEPKAEEKPVEEPHPEPLRAPKPNMTVQLAVCGLTLANEQRRQFDLGMVKKFGEIFIGEYHFKPGQPIAVFYDNLIKDAIGRGLIVNMGVRPL